MEVENAVAEVEKIAEKDEVSDVYVVVRECITETDAAKGEIVSPVEEMSGIFARPANVMDRRELSNTFGRSPPVSAEYNLSIQHAAFDGNSVAGSDSTEERREFSSARREPAQCA